MPDFRIRHPHSGLELLFTGDSFPSQEELENLYQLTKDWTPPARRPSAPILETNVGSGSIDSGRAAVEEDPPPAGKWRIRGGVWGPTKDSGGE